MAERIINILKRDIAAGKAKNCRKCPIALVINRILAPQYRCEVNCDSTIFISADITPGLRPLCVYSPLPDEAADFIAAFDDGKPVRPFWFTLEIPDECLL